MNKEIKEFIIARWMYSIGEEYMTDERYNALFELFKTNTPEELKEFMTRTWSEDPCPVELLKEEGLEDKIYKITLGDKSESMDSIRSLEEFSRYFSDVRLVDANDEETGWALQVLTPKIDGWNAQATYYNGELVTVRSRGRATDAVNFDRIRDSIPNKIPAQGEVKVYMELCTVDEDYLEVCRLYGKRTKRGAVSTALAEAPHLITPMAFDIEGIEFHDYLSNLMILESWGFNVVPYKLALNFNAMCVFVKEMSDNKDNYLYATDGIVCRELNGRHRVALRVGAWQEKIHASIITGYEETPGPVNYGFKVLIEPVEIDGSVYTRVNCYNLSYVEKYNLKVGEIIEFVRRSDAIPTLYEK